MYNIFGPYWCTFLYSIPYKNEVCIQKLALRPSRATLFIHSACFPQKIISHLLYLFNCCLLKSTTRVVVVMVVIVVYCPPTTTINGSWNRNMSDNPVPVSQKTKQNNEMSNRIIYTCTCQLEKRVYGQFENNRCTLAG